MPAWGLTEKQRTIEDGLGPWGLDPALLEPAKVTTDPIHGDIYTTVLEQAIIDSRPFQRLRRVRQLGTTHMVYPGATHSRFSHALGALRFVQDLLDAILTQHEGRHRVPDLVREWQDQGSGADRHVARTIVLVRLGALLHDIGHVPFGHSIEDDLKVLVPHDANQDRFVRLWAEISESVIALTRRLPGLTAPKRTEAAATLGTLLEHDGPLHVELRPMIIAKAPDTRAQEKADYPFAADLVGNTICADLLDYLLRDHRNMGLPIALGSRFISAFFIVPSRRGVFSQRLALNIVRHGHERTDVVTELLKALRYRYELSERALVHHAKLAADAMLGKALDCWSNALWLRAAAPRLGQLNDAEDLRDAGDIQAIRNRFWDEFEGEYEHQRVGQENWSFHPEVDVAVRGELEAELTERGDDGLVEFLASFAELEAGDDRTHADGGFGSLVLELHRQAGWLAARYRDRQLFKVAGRVGIQDAPARELHGTFGGARERAALEMAAQRFAGLEGGPRVLMWLPSPAMRVKIADVLVDDGTHVDRFAAYEEPRAGRGREIYSGHSRLWALWVYVDRALPVEQSDVVLAFLAEQLGVAWERKCDDWGGHYWDWVDRLALSRILEVGARDQDVESLLTTVRVAAAARTAAATFAARQMQLSRLATVRDARRAKGLTT